jgi:hypothetical protein
MALKEELEKMRPEIRTESYSMSIGEWISLYENGEIDIHPEFQRFFRWTHEQKTRLIESILLGIPIPPIFVSQRKDGIWDIIDGLQRLSTIFQFVGILKDENKKLIDPLIPDKTKYLPSLEGKKWNDQDDSKNSFDMSLRLYLKRAKLYVNILERESDEIAKYELFQRLNTGGSPLSDQEIRNCILVQKKREMFFWMRNLAEYENFKECTLLTERALEEQYDVELVLRFLVLRKIAEEAIKNIGDLGEFLTDKMIEIADSEKPNLDEEEKAFKQTFDILSLKSKENSFRKYDSKKKKYIGGFLITPFEVFALGIGYNYIKLSNKHEEIEEIIKKFWEEEPPELKAGSGVRASTRIPTTIHLGRSLFNL